MTNVLRWLGLAPSENEQRIIELVNSSNRAQSARVVGRGTVMIDVQQIRQIENSKSFTKKQPTLL